MKNILTKFYNEIRANSKVGEYEKLLSLIGDTINGKIAPENKKYYTLFEPGENNQIGIISVADLQKTDDVIKNIKKACEPHFDEPITVKRQSFIESLPFLSKSPTIAFEINLTDSKSTVIIEFAETWIYD